MTKTDIINRLNEISYEIEELQMELKGNEGRRYWTEKDVEFTKLIKKLCPNVCRVQRSVNGKNVAVFDKEGTMLLEMNWDPFCLPRLGPGEPIKVDEIIGGAE